MDEPTTEPTGTSTSEPRRYNVTQQPSQSEFVTPPSATHLPPHEDDEPAVRRTDPRAEINRLDAFLEQSGLLAAAHPSRAETTVDIAIRILTERPTRGIQLPRCAEAYCNQTAGHTTEHGWVNLTP